MSALSAGPLAGTVLGACLGTSVIILLLCLSIYLRRRSHSARRSRKTTEKHAHAMPGVSNDRSKNQAPHGHGLCAPSKWDEIESSDSLAMALPPLPNIVSKERSRYSRNMVRPMSQPGSTDALTISKIHKCPNRADYEKDKSMDTAGDAIGTQQLNAVHPGPNAFAKRYQPGNKSSPSSKSSSHQRKRLELRNSAFGDSGFSCILDKSQSEPSILPWNLDRQMSVGKAAPGLHAIRDRARSTSLCSQASGSAPTHPPPPLPLSSVVKAEQQACEIQREISSSTLESVSTSNSSILLTETKSPQMKARAEFSQRHPELSLGAQVRRREIDIKDIFANDSSSGATQQRKKRRLSNVNEALAKEKYSTPSPVHPALRPSEHSKFSEPRIVTQAVAERSPSTPSRRFHHITSASGSPAERRGHHGGRASALVESGSLNTRTTADKPSALKGSPRAKIKGHRRRNTVRILIEPTTFDFGLRRESASNFEKAENRAVDYPDRLDKQEQLQLPQDELAPRSKFHTILSQAQSSPRETHSTCGDRTHDHKSNASFALTSSGSPDLVAYQEREGNQTEQTESSSSGLETSPLAPRPLSVRLYQAGRMENSNATKPDVSTIHGTLSQRTAPKPRLPRPISCESQQSQSNRISKRPSLLHPLETKPLFVPPQPKHFVPKNVLKDLDDDDDDNVDTQNIWKSVQSLRRMDSEKLERYEEFESLDHGSMGYPEPWTTGSRGPGGSLHRYRRNEEEKSSDSGKENRYLKIEPLRVSRVAGERH